MMNETAKIKKALISKPVLSIILAGAVEECKGMSVQEIEDCIEGDVLIEEVCLIGEVIRTYLRLPNCSEAQLAKILIGSKFQKGETTENDNPAQNLFACCRMVSSQLATELSASSDAYHSEAIKKIYSILITEVNANSIERNGITKEMLSGDNPDQPGYDSIVAIIIRPNKNYDCGSADNELIRFLTDFFTDGLSAD